MFSKKKLHSTDEYGWLSEDCECDFLLLMDAEIGVFLCFINKVKYLLLYSDMKFLRGKKFSNNPQTLQDPYI